MQRYPLNKLLYGMFNQGVCQDGIKAIFWGGALRRFSISLVGLFIPIYVYQVGREAYGDMLSAIRVLVIFLFLLRLAVLAASFLTEYVVDTVGFRWSFLISSLFLVLKYLILPLAEQEIIYLYLGAVTAGIATASYWIPRHALFGEDQGEKVGLSVGVMVVLMRVVTVVGPVIGGLVASIFGFKMLFHIGLVFALLSAVPYFFMHHHRRHHPDGLRGFFNKIADPVNFPLILAWWGESWDSVLSTDFWPLYVFIMVGSLKVLGIITSLVAIVAVASVYLAGKFFDRSPKRKAMFICGSLLTALIWPLKALAKSIWPIFAVDFLDKSVNSFYWIPFLSETYKFTLKKDSVAFFTFREVIISLGILVLLAPVFMLTFSWSWMALFLLGSLGVMLSTSLVNYQFFD